MVKCVPIMIDFSSFNFSILWELEEQTQFTIYIQQSFYKGKIKKKKKIFVKEIQQKIVKIKHNSFI